MTALAAIENYIVQLGLAQDEILNAVTGGEADKTLSMRAAQARQEGKRWGCVLCVLLSVLVQRAHCAKQLAGEPMTAWSYLRAFACINLIWAIPVYFAA